MVPRWNPERDLAYEVQQELGRSTTAATEDDDSAAAKCGKNRRSEDLPRLG
jgi:hypothetical protein